MDEKRKHNTIRELYEWAQKNDALDMPIMIGVDDEECYLYWIDDPVIKEDNGKNVVFL